MDKLDRAGRSDFLVDTTSAWPRTFETEKQANELENIESTP